MSKQTYSGIGLMSGSSLDGLDLAAVEFQVKDNEIQDWKLTAQGEISFPPEIYESLKEVEKLDAKSLIALNASFGTWLGESTKSFILEHSLSPDFIASHGHTVFHEPENGFSLQIGNGANIAKSTNTLCISNFRDVDVDFGGQGAPLAPIVEHYLFSGYDFYLNIGGIANISHHDSNKVTAFDICPANQILNYLSTKLGYSFDNEGKIASSGKCDIQLLQDLQSDPFLKSSYPKSLSNSYIKNIYFTKLESSNSKVIDQLNTAVKFIAKEIRNSIQAILKNSAVSEKKPSLYITGGGVLNTYLKDELMKTISEVDIIIPNKNIVTSKEAILMSLLGLLRILEKPNSFSSVTGASIDTCNGTIHLPQLKL